MSSEKKIPDIIALHGGVMEVLNKQGDEPAITLANDIFRKFLTVCAASRLEEETKNAIRKIVREIAGHPGNLLLNLVEAGILERSYHNLFDWQRNNANRFYGFFGRDFRKFMQKKEEEDEDFADAAKSFVMLGRERNNLVHSDLAAAEFEWTERDVELRFLQAENFLPKFVRYALEFARGESGGDPPAP